MQDLKGMMGKDDSGNAMKKDAKLKVLKELRAMAAGMMGDDVKDGIEGMKKVTVAAPDKAGLAAGLAHAKDMLGQDDADSSDDSDDSSDDSDMHDDQDADHGDDQDASDDSDDSTDGDDAVMTPEEIQAKIADLQKMLMSMKR